MRNHTVTHAPDVIFHVLADPTRRAMLDLLKNGSQPAGQLSRMFPISRPAVSKHLRLLRRANLVRSRRSGRHRFYQLNPEPLQVVDQWLDHYRLFWHGRLAGLKALLESETVEGTQTKSKRKK